MMQDKPKRAAMTAAFAMALTGVTIAFAVPGDAADNADAKPAADKAADAPAAYEPPIASASDEAETAIAGFQVPDGFRVELFAAEPMVANPVAFHIDERGRVFVAETFRQGDAGGVVDNRNHMYWLDDDLAAQTVDDRRAFFKKHNPQDVQKWSTHHDRIRLLEDTDGDGKADKATVFSDGYNDLPDGTGAGVLAWRGNVYYTCIPKLYLLRDTDNDGKADEKQTLSEGYGVKVALRGHDLHGLVMGPDGRLYFSIGDRGYNVTTPEGETLKDVNSGAVFRCEPDGSNLEVIYTGLRNPQELAFDDYGNLFTGDNNSDAGDQARFTWIVEGGDTGWRMSYQYLDDRGPWNREGWWHLHDPSKPQAAFLTPPLAHISSGPSGLAYYPGTGLPDEYKGSFFLVDFRGGASNSGVHTFKLKPKGAAFEVVNPQRFIWNALPTDIDFGYDGAVYFTDWVHGWEGLGKGRVYRVVHPDAAGKTIVSQTAKLMREGFAHRPVDALVKLLSHDDRRIRQAAQFALVDRVADIAANPKQGESAYEGLKRTLEQSPNRLARIHAVWAFGQLVRRFNLEPAQGMHSTIGIATVDKDAEVRAQAVKTAAEHAHAGGHEMFVKLLKDESPRVRFYAAMAVGRARRDVSQSIDALAEFLKDNNDRDPFLRHAGVMGLTYLGDADALLTRAKDEHRSVRLGVLLALRRLGDPRLAAFLDDNDVAIVTEAARAISDLPIEGAMPQLADTLTNQKVVTVDAYLRRAINAAYWLGGVERAQALAQFAARSDMPAAARAEALDALRQWAGQSSRDRVLGVWRPVRTRPADQAVEAAATVVPAIIEGDAPAPVKLAAIELVRQYKLTDHALLLRQVVKEIKQPSALRVAGLSVLGGLDDAQLQASVSAALADDDAALRREARRWLAKLKPAEAVPVLEAVLVTGELAEKQEALRILADLKNAEADAVLIKWLDELIKGQVPLNVQLDLLEAARRRGTNRMKLMLATFEATWPKDDPMGSRAILLEGGDAARGKRLFWNDNRAQCQRCHKVGDEGAGEAGPNLASIGAKQKPAYILESLLLPNAQITKGFETVDIETLDGDRIIGVIREETDKAVVIVTPQNQRMTILVENIHARRKTKSAMPEDVSKLLNDFEVRDLTAYLMNLK